jgi:biopolymer transport protein ExbD
MRRNRNKAPFHLDIAPVNLIDLLLLLLIFFITTTTFLQLKVIELNIPSATNSETKYKKNLTYVVSIKENCDTYFEKEKYDTQGLGKIIEEKYLENRESIFQIAAHEETPHRCFIDVLDIFKEYKIENISILTKKRR